MVFLPDCFSHSVSHHMPDIESTVLSMLPWALILSWSSLIAWLYLAVLHGGARHPYWVRHHRLEATVSQSGHTDQADPAVAQYPPIVAIVPARDEADVIGPAITSLLCQDYLGRFDIILIDDGSTDATSMVARNAASALGRANRLHVLSAPPTPAGWTGKLWAMEQGVSEIKHHPHFRQPPLLLFTDADIHHQPGLLTALYTKAQKNHLDAVSLMVRLHQQGFWEQMLVPAFVYFFGLLYPFSSVNNPQKTTAGAAGGCLLVRRTALEAAGGLAAIRSSIIDDCALAARLKANGTVWLGLTQSAKSIRPYNGLGGLWSMVTRSAYAQLACSPWLLTACLAGLVLVFLVPPVALIEGIRTGEKALSLAGGLAWGLMCLTYIPILCEYRFGLLKMISLPIAACLYILMTIDSARRHWQGRGGLWKGRLYRYSKN